MKLVLILAITMIAQFSFAAYETEAEQLSLVEKVAKETRRHMHAGGYDDVGTSTPQLVTAKFLNDHYANKENHESSLTKEEYTKLYNCLNSNSCALWYFDGWSSMYGGSGQSGHFVLIYLQSGKHFTITHGIYAE